MGLGEGSGFSWAGHQGAGLCDGPCPWDHLRGRCPSSELQGCPGLLAVLVPSCVWNFLCHLVGVLSLHFLPETQIWLPHFEGKREGRGVLIRAGVPPTPPG